ncbi:hypothetical protein HDEF_0748 [Candidatus Hamiltonella defensa 5AT (Acyrthosiphon pisum)]|uniref:Uncharacterized protein n=1 Tax=Hamiltonella defensa subsp. Acyrthosiphon pisum (strain 5AT) TaxID=572265 RepID=C4K4I5_HAMD5|nr:hypothetical protein HDEF_0748 [Candidatus Hamiltonella defensa 5AT (Acyrthosiphon pisum)]
MTKFFPDKIIYLKDKHSVIYFLKKALIFYVSIKTVFCFVIRYSCQHNPI